MTVNLRTALTVYALFSVLLPTAGWAQTKLPLVRVVTDDAEVASERRSTNSRVVASPSVGTTLEALGVQDGWVWVLLPPDLDRTKKSGWIRARHVEMVSTGPQPISGIAAALDVEHAAAQARLRKAREALDRAREEYEKVTAETVEAADQP